VNSPSRRARLTAATIALPLATALTLSGCSTHVGGAVDVAFLPQTSPAVGDLDRVKWSLPQEPAVLDPDAVSDTSASTVLANVCDRLMQVQPDLTTQPGLASSAEWTDDTTIKFILRPNVRFHDGSTMDADSVVWSLQRHMAEDAEESDEYGNVESVSATGPLEVTVKMKQRDAIFLQAMAGNGGIIFSPSAVADAGDNFGGPGSTDACSGRYRVGEWKSGTSLTLNRFDEYWNTDRTAHTQRILFTWADDDAVTNSLIGGEVQGAYLGTAAAAVPLLGNSDFTVAQGPATNAWSLIPTRSGLLSDVRVRRALSLALDREGVARAGFASLATPAKTPLGEGAWGYERDAFAAADEQLEGAPAKPSADDLEAATSLIREAGDEGKELVVASDGQPVRNVIANSIASAAKKIGLSPKIIVVPPQQYGDFYSDEALRAKADLFSDEYYISKNDPVGFYKNAASTAGLNYLGFNDPAVDAMIPKAKAATDETARAALAIALQNKWNDAMIWIPVVETPTTLAMASDITGAVASAAYLYYPWAADLGAARKDGEGK
jgi:peptide/nickel transport system substrate-binding protein